MAKLQDYVNPINIATEAVGGLAGGINAVKSLFQNRKKMEREADERQANQQTKLNEINAKTNKELADYDQMLKMKMWQDTNYGAQMKQAQIAGVSKAAAIGGGGQGVGGATSVGTAGVGAGASGGAANQQAALNAEMMGAQIRNLDANTAKTTAQTGNIEEGTTGVKLDNTLKDKTMNAMITLAKHKTLNSYEEYRENKLANEWTEFMQDTDSGGRPSIKEQEVKTKINEGIAYVSEVEKAIEVMGKQLGVMDANISNIGADTALAKQLHGHLSEKNKTELKQLSTNLEMSLKELEKMKNDPNYSRWGQYLNYTMDKIEQVGGIVGSVRKGAGSVIKTSTSEYKYDTQGRESSTHRTTTQKRK